LASGGHVVTTCVCEQFPKPSQPAAVHALSSVSPHGVLSGASGCLSQLPLSGLQISPPSQGGTAGAQATFPTKAQSALPLHWSIVHLLPSASQGVPGVFGVSAHCPMSWLHILSRHCVEVHVGHRGMELDCVPVDWRLLSHVASMPMYPAVCWIWLGVLSTLGARTLTSNSSAQNPGGLAWLGGMSTGAVAVKTISFGAAATG
jgi:hypothetical protein